MCTIFKFRAAETEDSDFHLYFIPVYSCDSLVKVCIPIDINSSEIRVAQRNYVHLAEVAFYGSSTPCPPFTTIPGNWTTPTTTQGKC